VTAYLLRRISQAVAVVVGVLILTFIMIHLEPGSVARANLGFRATQNRIDIFNAAYGLNQSIGRQFLTYVDQVFHGNFGTSYEYQEPVSTLIAQRLPCDFVFLGISTVLALLIAIPMGIYQAVRRNGVLDYSLTGVSFTLYSMPDFFFAILLIAIFSIQFRWLPPPTAPTSSSLAGVFAQPSLLVLPVVTMTLITVSSFSRYMRSSAIDVLAEDYIRVARAKGLPTRLILMRHVLRNSLLPVVTIVGLSLPSIVSGAVIAETVFNYPGMGLLFFQGATHHDFPILLATTLITGVATVIGSLGADICYAVLDPRVRYGRA
jgi:peptide/nickel transport system permease protein